MVAAGKSEVSRKTVGRLRLYQPILPGLRAYGTAKLYPLQPSHPDGAITTPDTRKHTHRRRRSPLPEDSASLGKLSSRRQVVSASPTRVSVGQILWGEEQQCGNRRRVMKTKACGCVCKLCVAAGLVFLGLLVLAFSWSVSLIGAVLAALATHSSLVMGITSLTITVVLAVLILLRIAYR